MYQNVALEETQFFMYSTDAGTVHLEDLRSLQCQPMTEI
jgi:hypothetical protein